MRVKKRKLKSRPTPWNASAAIPEMEVQIIRTKVLKVRRIALPLAWHAVRYARKSWFKKVMVKTYGLALVKQMTL